LTLIALGGGGWFERAALTPDFGTLRLFIPLLVIGAAIFSWLVFGRLQQQYALNPFGIAAHRTLVLCTATAFLWLL
jgi:hypothetical protein